MQEINFKPLKRDQRNALASVVRGGEIMLFRLASPRRGDRAPAVIMPVPTWERLCRQHPNLAPDPELVDEVHGFKAIQARLATDIVRPVQQGRHVMVSWTAKDSEEWAQMFAPRSWYESVTGEVLDAVDERAVRAALELESGAADRVPFSRRTARTT